MKGNLNYYHRTSHKCKYDELKLMLRFKIRIRLDPDLFNWIWILQGAMGVCGAIFHDPFLIGIRVVANLPDLRSLILHLWNFTAQQTAALKRPIFKRKKGFANLSLGLIYYSIASSQQPSRDTVHLKLNIDIPSQRYFGN
jgi:hypothetical protein